MPLPAALLSRLQKRGIVKQDAHDEVEEVFAESYDEKENETEISQFPVKLVFEVADCPNTSNRYHECSVWCSQHWGLRTFTHSLDLDKKRHRLLKKYPLPPGWMEVGDPQTGRCYYWNSESDKVSWLPPQHPRAKITVSAEKLKSSLQTHADDVLSEKRKPVSVSIRDNTEKTEKKRRRVAPTDDLDPMDPAAYSEVERGGWNVGLKSDVKTGVDSTANGPLFQQRPYPSPGDILRAQASKQSE